MFNHNKKKKKINAKIKKKNKKYSKIVFKNNLNSIK